MSRSIHAIVGFSVLLVSTMLLAGCRGPNLIERAQDPFAYGCCGLIILILNIIAIVEILNSTWTTGSKVLWILLIIFLPVLGLILYYVFARS